jgi:flavin reductase (DIM6/NTAB) family NADH-FMN oxidoreductase RutF
MAETIENLDFRRACARFATGVTIATTMAADGAAHGFTANSFTSVSMEPPIVLICIDHRANVIAHFNAATVFAINVLESSQERLSNRFAERGQDRFDGVDWSPGVNGAPILLGAIAHFECTVESRIPTGDHTIILGRVTACHHTDSAGPLLYFASRYHHL